MLDALAARTSVVALLIACGSCGQSDLAKLSDVDIHRMAEGKTLEETYALHEKVMDSTVPQRSIVADDLAKFGEQAWSYAINRALTGSEDDLAIAFPVLRAIPNACSKDEYEALRRKVSQISTDPKDLSVWRFGIRTACKLPVSLKDGNPSEQELR